MACTNKQAKAGLIIIFSVFRLIKHANGCRLFQHKKQTNNNHNNNNINNNINNNCNLVFFQRSPSLKLPHPAYAFVVHIVMYFQKAVCSTVNKVSSSKIQCNSLNACMNEMCKCDNSALLPGVWPGFPTRSKLVHELLLMSRFNYTNFEKAYFISPPLE